MKVLIVHSTNNIISGAEFAINDMLKEIPEGFEFEMLTPGKSKLSNFYKEKGFKVHTIPFSGPRRKHLGLYLITSLALSLWLWRHKFDIVLCNTFAASFRVSLGTKLAGKRLLIYTREYFSKKNEINFKQISRADTILAVSEDVRNYYENLHPAVFVCHDQIDINAIEQKLAVKKADLLDKKVINIGFIGRITTYKQPDLFIRAIPHVIKEFPNIQFHIIGKSIPAEAYFENSLKTLAKELNVENHVHFWGHREDSVEILSELNVFCLTSDREPFPRTILEAMTVKTPVVCSNTGGCCEIIRDNFSGLYFEVSAKDAAKRLAFQIIRLLQDRNLYEEIQKNALVQVKETFGGNEQATNFFNALMSVIKNNDK